MRVRSAADLDVAFVVPDKPGSPFEQVFTGPPEAADLVIRDAVAFVCDLLSERIVLAYDARHLRGGRRFLEADSDEATQRRHLSWIVSWLGTYDWEAPTGD